MIRIKMDYKSIITTALVGGLSVWIVSRMIKNIYPDIAKKIDPVNPDNIFNQYSDKIFDAVVPDSRKYNNIKGKWGAWFYDFVHGPADL